METRNEPIREVQKSPKIKGSARETLYRVTMQNQINSIGIADQKANIIIGITTKFSSQTSIKLNWMNSRNSCCCGQPMSFSW